MMLMSLSSPTESLLIKAFMKTLKALWQQSLDLLGFLGRVLTMIDRQSLPLRNLLRSMLGKLIISTLLAKLIKLWGMFELAACAPIAILRADLASALRKISAPSAQTMM
jgi:hypothetical protein